MRKIHTLIYLLWFTVDLAQAQAFGFYKEGNLLANDAEIVITEIVPDPYSGDYMMESDISVKNLNDEVQTAILTQTILEYPSTGELSFCFLSCVNGNMNLSQKALLQPGIFYPGLHLYFCVGEREYTSVKVKYEIYPEDNPSEKVTLTVAYTYNDPLSVEFPPSKERFDFYCSDGNAILEYSSQLGGSRLDVYTITGLKVASCLLDYSGSYLFPFSFSKGIYLFSFQKAGKKLLSQKYVIQ